MSYGLPAAAAADVDIGAQVTIASDYMFRGVSQTMSQPALQAELAAEYDNGWYGWVWASNVDFVAAGDPDDGADLEINVAVGYQHDVSDSLTVNVEGVAYVFPGTKTGYDYDYAEWLLGLQIHERYRLTFGYSKTVFGTNDSGRFYAAATTLDLTSRSWLDLELGYYDLDEALDMSYRYAEASFVYDAEPLQWRLSYFMGDDAAAPDFGSAAVRDRLVVAVNISF
jgi:uncharacterized protein (TIGR02001 family)